MKGIVIKSTGKWYQVRLLDQRIIACRIKGKFRLKDYKLTNPIAVGDEVEVELEQHEENGMITNVSSRKNYVLRQSTRKKHFMHLLAANIDQALVIVTIQNPTIKPGFIDRFLLTTEIHNIPTVLIINKRDLHCEQDEIIEENLKRIYEEIGYQTLTVSALNGMGFDELKSILKAKTTLISGHSGVGKSTIINRLQPNLELDTNEISDYSGKGIHTTTFSEMFPLDFGGNIIDTPGIKELGFINMEPVDVAHNYREIFKASSNCKFSDCLHLNEPNCAVKDAIESGSISLLRYQSYCSIMDELTDQNSWERHTDW